MLYIDEYIHQRKLEDGMNEFDTRQRLSNIRSCINYIFEYFDQYLNIEGAENRTSSDNEKIRKYERALRHFSPDVKNWLVSIYDIYKKQINRNISNILYQSNIFPFMYEDSDFRAISYECYTQLVKRFPFIKDQSELLFKFIKEYHFIESTNYGLNIPDFSSRITEWINNTFQEYHVNLIMGFTYYLNGYWDNRASWPAKYKIKVESSLPDFQYCYNVKAKENLFNIHTLYGQLGNRPFIKNHKKHMEILLMYLWLHKVDDTYQDYWDIYLATFPDF